MIIKGNVTLKAISAQLSNDIIGDIEKFIQGSVYCWCKNCQDNGVPKWFGAIDLFGGENKDWQCTPLIELYNWHVKNGTTNPVDMAGRDVGQLLKKVIEQDCRNFETRRAYRREYRWIKELDKRVG